MSVGIQLRGLLDVKLHGDQAPKPITTPPSELTGHANFTSFRPCSRLGIGPPWGPLANLIRPRLSWTPILSDAAVGQEGGADGGGARVATGLLEGLARSAAHGPRLISDLYAFFAKYDGKCMCNVPMMGFPP